MWVPHRYLYQNHSKELCKFYEKNMIFRWNDMWAMFIFHDVSSEENGNFKIWNLSNIILLTDKRQMDLLMSMVNIVKDINATDR